MYFQRAFTLLETIACVLIFMIILLFAAHNMATFRKTQQAQLISKELQHIVHSARGLALTKRRALTLCGSTDGYSCDQNWSQGALLFEDTNRNGQFDSDEFLVKYTPFALKNSKLIWKGFLGSFMRFESMGITSASNGTFTYCQTDHDPRFSRQVIVSRGGRARLSQDKNGDGIHEDISGAAKINCP